MFKVGDKVVYPMHGAGRIESIEELAIVRNAETKWKQITEKGHNIQRIMNKREKKGI